MNDRTNFFFNSSANPIVSFDNTTLVMMLTGMMANVISWIEHVDFANEKSHQQKVMEESIQDWADHGYQNTMWSQADFVYRFFDEYLKQDVSINYIFLNSRGQFELFIKMTERVEHYRNKIRDEERRKYGKNFGSALEFYNFNWLALNHKIRERYLRG